LHKPFFDPAKEKASDFESTPFTKIGALVGNLLSKPRIVNDPNRLPPLPKSLRKVAVITFPEHRNSDPTKPNARNRRWLW
jgi:hypothetical protein